MLALAVHMLVTFLYIEKKCGRRIVLLYRAKNGYDLLFLYYMLRMNQNRIYSLQIGGAQPHVYSKDLAMMRVQIPTLSEQEK